MIPIVLALAPTYLVRLSIGGIPTTLFELVIYGTVLGALVRSRGAVAPAKERWAPVMSLGLGMVLVGTIIGVVLSADRRTALGEAKAFIIDPLLVAWLIIRSVNLDELPNLLGWYLASAAAVSLVGLAGWLFHAGWAVAADGRLLGLYGLEPNASPNYLAFWLAPAVALGIAWIGTARRKLQESSIKSQISSKSQAPKSENGFGSWMFGSYLELGGWNLRVWLILVATVISFAALIATDSRAGIASAIVGGVVALIAYYRSTLVEFRFAQGLGWLLLIGLVLFGVAVVQPDFGQNVATGGRISSSNNIRWEIWNTTGRLLTVSPTAFIGGLGVGGYQAKFGELTQHQVNYPEFITPRALTPHNLWMNTWVNLGLLGLVGVTILLAAAFWRLWQAEPTHKAALVTAVLLTIALQGLVDTPNWKNDTSVLFWAVLAAAALVTQPMDKRK